MNEKNIDFVQVRLWNDCINNCTFCSLQDRCRKTSIASKIVRIKKARDLIKTLHANVIGLIGGEFFEGQLKGCEKEWMRLLDNLSSMDAKIYITANLIHKQYFLKETIDALKNKLLICTSYDEVGRFHTKTAKDNWFKNIEELHNRGIEVFCTCIPTQDFLESDTKFPEWLGINLCDPHLGVDWYINVDKKDYHKHLISENSLFNLPKRNTAVRWFQNHPSISKNYASYAQTHSDTIYSFDSENSLITEFKQRIASKDYVNPECGHQFFCQCYADSNKCMMCDAQSIVASL